jgi:hypothetical protein
MTGLVDIDWDEIEIDLNSDRPKIYLHGKADRKAKQLKIREWLATWTECDQYILVRVLALSTYSACQSNKLRQTPTNAMCSIDLKNGSKKKEI